MMDVGKLIVDYIDTLYPDAMDQKQNAEIYCDAVQSIRFLADRDWKEYLTKQKD